MSLRHILHFDLDAMFAAVEALLDPSLAGKPVIVGASPGTRGVVFTCSYEARAYGVHPRCSRIAVQNHPITFATIDLRPPALTIRNELRSLIA